MATDGRYELAVKKQVSKIEDYINNNLKNYSSKMTTLFAEAFVAGAKKRLLDRATPRDDVSKAKVQSVAKSIHIGKSSDDMSKTVIVPKGDEGLGMFLEYGTGLVGNSQKHPQSKSIGWEYAVNRDNYTYRKASPDIAGKLGFTFYRGNNYLDKNDINPLYRVSYKYVKKTGKTYVYHYWNRQWVHSQGLKPLRYMYDTRISLSGILSRYKKLPDGAIKLKKRLEKYKQNGK